MTGDELGNGAARIPAGARGGLSLGAPRSSRGRGLIGRRGGTGGNSRPAGPGETSTRPSQQQVVDTAVRATDDDALGSRMSAIEAGYLSPDPFCRFFLTSHSPMPPSPPSFQTPSPQTTFPIKRTIDRGGAGSSSSSGRIPITAPRSSPPPSSFPLQRDRSSEVGSRAVAAPRRPPIINIGTYLRCRAIDDLVDRFLNDDTGTRKQIISLGAGSDTRFWRLSSSDHIPKSRVHHYMEVDFEQNVRRKVDRIRRHEDLSKALGKEDIQIEDEGTRLLAPHYSLLSQDLRSLHRLSIDIEKLLPDLEAPTLILAECVLAYLNPSDSRALLAMLAEKLKRPAAICYEMCVAGPFPSNSHSTLHSSSEAVPKPSRFGNVMLNNLEARNLVMPGAREYSTPQLHAKRFEDAFVPRPSSTGKEEASNNTKDTRGAHATTLKQVWLDLDSAERDRISRLEGLDEVEELEILLDHYAVSWFGIG